MANEKHSSSKTEGHIKLTTETCKCNLSGLEFLKGRNIVSVGSHRRPRRSRGHLGYNGNGWRCFCMSYHLVVRTASLGVAMLVPVGRVHKFTGIVPVVLAALPQNPHVGDAARLMRHPQGA